MVATGAPAARYSPTDARRSLTAPSIGESDDGVGELLARQLELGAPLERARPDGCAPPRARPGNGPPPPASAAIGRVELGAGDQLLLRERSTLLSRVSRASSSIGAGLTDDGGLLGVHPVVGARRREPEPGARLLQRGHGLIDAKLEVALDRGAPTTCPLLNALPRSTVVSATRPATFVPSTTCSSAARVPVAETVRATVRSAAGVTLTSRGAGPAGLFFCSSAPTAPWPWQPLNRTDRLKAKAVRT